MKLSWKSIIVLLPVLLVFIEIVNFNNHQVFSYLKGVVLLIPVGIYLFQNNRFRLDVISKTMLLFLSYTFIISFFSSDLIGTFQSYVSIFTSMVLYLISFNTFSKWNDINYFKFPLTIIPLLFIINLILYSGLGLGEAAYGGILHFGNLHNNAIYTGVLILLVGTIFHKYIKYKFLNVILLFALLIILLVSLRRTAIILIFSGFFIYLLMADFKQTIKLGFPIVLLLLLTFPYYSNFLITAIEARGQRATLEQNIENEARFREITIISDRSFSFNNLNYSLFGKEYLNSEGTYATASFRVRSDRVLHTDYARLLHGSGIIGLTLYFIILLAIGTKSYRHIKYFGVNNNISIVLSILFMILLLVTFSGSILSISFRSTNFIILGMFMGIADKTRKDENMNRNSKNKEVNCRVY